MRSYRGSAAARRRPAANIIAQTMPEARAADLSPPTDDETAGEGFAVGDRQIAAVGGSVRLPVHSGAG
jgi:hypothetical protein